MTADIRILKPRKSKRLKSKAQAKAKQNVIQVWFGCEFQGKKAITYPPELLPVPDSGVEVEVIIKCNRPDCIGEVCPYCEADTGKLLTEIFKAQQKLYGPKGKKP